jgi:ligand-binding sensor domain-containing protein/signal transduction histidine kinase/DNA-binding response OmpR family regulator
MFKQLISFVYLLLLLSSYALGSNVRFRKITSSQGLSHNTIYAITQDEQGFMWFGTREGLNRFDGRNLKSYYIETSPGKSTNQINALLSYQKSIYVGTNHGLYRYDMLQDRLVSFPLKSHMPSVNFLLEIHGTLYVGTSTGLFLVKGGTITTSIRGFARAMCVLSKDRLLLAVDKRILILDSAGHIERAYTLRSLSAIIANGFTVFNIHRDPKGRIWLGTTRGLYHYDDQSQRFTQLHFTVSENAENNTVRSVSGNALDLLYIGTEDGLYIHDLNSGQTSNYQQSFDNDPKKLNDKAIYTTFIGKEGTVWLGTYFGGVNYIPPQTESFQNILPSNGGSGLSGKAVSQLMEDSIHRIWIATEDGGISVYNPARASFDRIDKNSSPFYLNTNNVHALHNDGYGNIWAGTFMGGLHRYDLSNKTTTVYIKDPADSHSLSNNQVYAVYRDSRGTLWVGTQQGLNQFNYKTGEFSLLAPEILGNKFIYDLIEDKNGDLWFCSRQDGIYRYNPVSKVMQHYTNEGKEAPLLSNQIISVYKDRGQQLWFGTLDGGACVYNFTTNSFQHYTTSDGLANNNVYGILEDDAGFIWLSTNLGISKWNPRTKKFINYDSKHGLGTNQFNFKSFLKGSDGAFYFGSINGLCYFNPLKVLADNQSYPLVFTNFQLFNKDERPDSSSSILRQQIAYTHKINLSYNQNVFTISYIAINYANPGSTRYAYYLEGFEGRWNYVGNKTSATYTNLSPGDYIFHVRTLDEAGDFIGRERTISIHVTPPFYRSDLAYAFYALLVAMLIYLYTRFVRFIHQKHTEIQLAHMEKDKTEALTQHRINFFTFISHEFKTPLTLILASIDKFINEKNIDLKEHTELSHIKKNASKLFRLIHQLAEFRKVDSDNLSVHLTRSDMVDFVVQMVESFETLAQEKCLTISFNPDIAKLVVFFDVDKLEKILSNILSNAMKHTEEGEILVLMQTAIEKGHEMVRFTICDTGTGMSTSDLKHIFDPFYRSPSHKAITGTGIGMALVYNLVKSLQGTINAISEPGKGTTISFSLPVYENVNSQQQQDQEVIVTVTNEPTFAKNIPPKVLGDAQQYTLLLVEDNKELLHFLAQHFQAAYCVMTATNGASAWKKINRTPPDIIISDVKMPKTDGLELCLKLKQNKQFDHIPFILLSDSQDEQLKVNGLDIGADAYVGKPFNLKELELVVANMVKSRIKLREHVVALGTFASDHEINNNRNQDFLSRLSGILEKHYANPELTVEDLANELNTSRTSLHLNLKRILHKNATELLNEYRLKKALVMLENDIPVNEIAYHCGYREPNYFSRVFKKHYQLSPHKYKETHFKKN